MGDAFDIRKCRYAGIYLLADADPDGRHIIALLLSLFVRHMPDLIRAEMVHVVLNPLFMGTTATKRVFGNTVEDVKKQIGKNAMIRRFKGVGELNADELQECAMDPKTRRVLRVLWDEENDLKLVLSYMGKDGAARKELLDVVG